MPPDSTVPTRRRLSREERRADFLDTAADIVADHGVSALTMEGVAARAGVNKALGYRYFSNRDDLLVALFAREAERFDDEVRARSATCETLDEHLRALLDVYLDSLTSGAMIVTLEGARVGSGPFEEARQARGRDTVAYVAELIRRYYPMSGRTATTAAGVFTAGAQGLVNVWEATGWPRKRFVDDFVTMCIGAVEALAHANDAVEPS